MQCRFKWPNSEFLFSTTIHVITQCRNRRGYVQPFHYKIYHHVLSVTLPDWQYLHYPTFALFSPSWNFYPTLVASADQVINFSPGTIPIDHAFWVNLWPITNYHFSLRYVLIGKLPLFDQACTITVHPWYSMKNVNIVLVEPYLYKLEIINNNNLVQFCRMLYGSNCMFSSNHRFICQNNIFKTTQCHCCSVQCRFGWHKLKEH